MSTFRESIHIQSSNDPALIAIHIDLKQLNIILFSFFFYIYTFKGSSGEVCKHYPMETPLHISNREFTADSSFSQLVTRYIPLPRATGNAGPSHSSPRRRHRLPVPTAGLYSSHCLGSNIQYRTGGLFSSVSKIHIETNKRNKTLPGKQTQMKEKHWPSRWK